MFSKTFRKLLPMFSVFAIASVHCTTKHKTYLWGNGYYQARPDALLQFKNFTPKQITNLPDNLVKLAFGQFYEAGIDSKGQLYIWDAKSLDSNISNENKDNTVKGLKKLDKDIQEVKFTKGYIWALTKKGNVYQYPIVKKIQQNQIKGVQIGQKRQVQPLRGSKQIATGEDHVLALNQKGEIFAMGDDTLGQCGQCDTNRHTHPPFTQKRIKFPLKVQGLPKITKIVSGSNHCLALDQNNVLYGWGSNSNLQLSHQQQFSAMTKPLLCTYTPLKISKNLDNNIIEDVVAGEQFTIIITRNRATQNCQVFSTGNNLRGQLAVNQVRHLKDISKIESLSNYIMKVKGQQKKVAIKQISCGYKHCIALLNIGYIMQWGDNQYGQMGNKKRSPATSPIVVRDFVDKQIYGVFAGVNSSGVIVVQDDQKNK